MKSVSVLVAHLSYCVHHALLGNVLVGLFSLPPSTSTLF